MLNKQSADCSGENLFSISNIIPIELSNIELTGWEAKRLKGCIFSPPSLLPVTGRGKEVRKRNLSSLPTPSQYQAKFHSIQRQSYYHIKTLAFCIAKK